MLDENTIDEKGNAPEERFSTASQVREVACDLISNDKERAQRRKSVQGLIDGNRPYRHKAIENWRSNFNPREAEGLVQAVRTPYYDLVNEPNPSINLEVDFGDSSEQQAAWAMVIAEEFREALFSWPCFDWHIQLQQNEMLVHGVGAHVWTTQTGWMPRTFKTGRVLFQPGASSDPAAGGWEHFSVRDKMKPHELWRQVRNESSSTLGWNREAAFKAIRRASNKSGGSASDIEETQAQMRAGDIGASRGHADIDVSHVFSVEYDGSVTHYIVAENEQFGGNEFLFKKRSRFKSIENVISLFPYDIGSDGTIHSVKGIGARFYHMLTTSARVINSMVDAVFLGTGIMVSQEGVRDPSKLNLMSLGLLKVLPQGMKIEPQKLNDLSQGPISLHQTLKNVLSENTRTFRHAIAQSDLSSDPSASEFSGVQSDQARLRRSSHSLYYRNLTRYYRETLRRMIGTTRNEPGGEIAERFRQQCLKRGVPEQALDFQRLHKIEAVQDVGSGSAAQKLAIWREFMNVLYPIADEETRVTIRRMWAQALAGHPVVDLVAPRRSENEIASNDDSIAQIENNDFMDGKSAVVAPAQDHVRHAMKHRELAIEAITQLREGGAEPDAVLRILEPLLIHLREHIGRLQTDPTRKAQSEMLFKEWVEMTKLVDQLRQQVGEAQEAREEQAQQLSEKAMLDMEKIRLDAQNKARAIEIDGELKRAAFERDSALKDAQSALSA